MEEKLSSFSGEKNGRPVIFPLGPSSNGLEFVD